MSLYNRCLYKTSLKMQIFQVEMHSRRLETKSVLKKTSDVNVMFSP